MRLIAAETHVVTHQPDLAVLADDGVTLLTDRRVATADIGTGTRMRPVSIEIHRGGRRPSAVVLPTIG